MVLNINPVHVTLTYINTLRPRQNGRHFPDDIFKCIRLNENLWISMKISLSFVPENPCNNVPALVQIMAWYWKGNKPKPMVVNSLTHVCVTWPQWVNGLVHVYINSSEYTHIQPISQTVHNCLGYIADSKYIDFRMYFMLIILWHDTLE